MKNEVLLKAFEQMANDNRYVNSVRNKYNYRDDLGLTAEEKSLIREYFKFRIYGMGMALTKVINAFQTEEYEYFDLIHWVPFIKNKETSLPKPENEFRSTQNYIVISTGSYDYMSFYAFEEELCMGCCDDRLDYPFPYVKEFIDEVIKFRIKYGIKEIADYGLDALATEFIKARLEQLEVGSGARVRSKKSSQ